MYTRRIDLDQVSHPTYPRKFLSSSSSASNTKQDIMEKVIVEAEKEILEKEVQEIDKDALLARKLASMKFDAAALRCTVNEYKLMKDIFADRPNEIEVIASAAGKAGTLRSAKVKTTNPLSRHLKK